MQALSQGMFYGRHHQSLNFNQFLITDTLYTHNKVDWHYHEHPYFTFLLNGKLFEANKKEEYYLAPGNLLFHNWQDAHYNIKAPEYTRGFHIELTKDWFANYQVSLQHIEGSIHINNPFIKQNISKIFLASKMPDVYTQTSIEMLLLNTFHRLEKQTDSYYEKHPSWVPKLIAIIHDAPEICLSLQSLATELGLHPVHLSRQFPKYFQSTLGQYIKAVKLHTALPLLLENNQSITQIALEVGFYDQSHFTHAFKQQFGITPLTFRKKTSPVNFLQF